MLKSYLPILVFAFLGLTVGTAFAMLNHVIGPKRPKRPTAASKRQAEPYESGIPVEAARGFRFGVSFYLVAMLFREGRGPDGGPGTGLGLAIAKGIMEAHGGAIKGESPAENGRGARFIMTFPREEPPA